MEKIKYKIAILFIILVALISFTNASGVVTPYFKSGYLELTPGESSTVTLYLQNMAGEPQDITINANITAGSEIAQIIDDNDLLYEVPFGTENVTVKVKIDIPADKEIGSIDQIMVSFKQVSTNGGGMLEVSSGFTSKIPVKIVSKKEEPSPSAGAAKKTFPISIMIIIIIAIVAISIIIWYVKRSKEENSKKQASLKKVKY